MENFFALIPPHPSSSKSHVSNNLHIFPSCPSMSLSRKNKPKKSFQPANFQFHVLPAGGAPPLFPCFFRAWMGILTFTPPSHWPRKPAAGSPKPPSCTPPYPGATPLLDRHYNSFRPYRKTDLKMYAVLKNDTCAVRYAEAARNHLILRPDNQSKGRKSKTGKVEGKK